LIDKGGEENSSKKNENKMTPEIERDPMIFIATLLAGISP